MWPPARCTTCGLPVSDLYELFKSIRTERIKAEMKAKKLSVDFAHHVQIDMSDVFDQLKIEHDCCRRTFTSAMEFKNHY